jgi:hypothetical protein
MDAEALFLGWMDEHVKGLPLGIMDAYPNAVISVDKTRERDAATWDVETTFDLGLNNDDFTLGTASGSQQMLLQPAPEPVQGQVNEIVQTAQVSYTGTLTEDLLVHAPILDLQGTLVGGNGFVYAALYADGRLLTEGMRQLALDDTYETWTPIVSAFDVDLPFRPTELYLEAGTELRLDIRGVQAGVDGVIGGETLGTAAPIPAELTIENSALQFPTVGGARPISLTALP